MPHFQIGLDRLDVGRPVGELERGHVLRGVFVDGRKERPLRVVQLEQPEGFTLRRKVQVSPRPIGAVVKHGTALLDEGADVEALAFDELAAAVVAWSGEKTLGKFAEIMLQHKVGSLVEQ